MPDVIFSLQNSKIPIHPYHVLAISIFQILFNKLATVNKKILLIW